MKAWIFSDLHLEFQQPFRFTPPPGAEVIVCAGDILTKGIIPSINWLAATYAGKIPVVFVPGNHEFFGASLTESIRDAREYAKRFPNIHLLQNEAVVIGDTRFLGGTLWTDFRLSDHDPGAKMAYAEYAMKDYRRIKFSKQPYRRFKAANAFREHVETRDFIAREFPRSSMKTVVVTHHAPSARSIPVDDRGDPEAAFYASDLEGMIEAVKPKLWVHGHVDRHVTYKIGDTDVIANPRGYSRDRSNFDPGFVADT